VPIGAFFTTMKKLRWQIIIVILALVAIGFLLLGQQPTLLPVVPEIKPVTGGEYTEGLVGSLGRLNPVLDHLNPVDRDVDRLIYSRLINFDDRGLQQYDLVESMGISQDGTIYNFSLRDNLVWHDGEPLTTDDIIFTIELLRDENIPTPDDIRELWNSVEAIPLNEQTLQLRIPEPYSPFLDYLTFGILPKHLLDGIPPESIVDSEFHLNPIGSGPYQFDQYIVDEGQIIGVVLVKFDDYYLEPPYIEQVIFYYFQDYQAAHAAYEDGEIDGINQVALESLPQALKEPELNLYSGRFPVLSLVYLNLDNPQVPFFQDINVRLALQKGINRSRIIRNYLDGQAILADGPIFPGTWAYYEGIDRVDYDPDGAISLLKEAGYTIPAAGGSVRELDGTPLEFDLIHPDDELHTALAKAVGEDWQRIGVGVKLTAMPYEELMSQRLEPRLYQAALVDLNLLGQHDPDPYQFWHQSQITGGQNYAKWDDRQASEYLEQARIIVDLEERNRLYRNFQVRFRNELPSILLFYPVYTYAVGEHIQGVTMGPLFETSDRFATVTSWFLNAERTTEMDIIEEEGSGEAGGDVTQDTPSGE
jgi:peptide/nickel transport system substrate-binding protein